MQKLHRVEFCSCCCCWVWIIWESVLINTCCKKKREREGVKPKQKTMRKLRWYTRLHRKRERERERDKEIMAVVLSMVVVRAVDGSMADTIVRSTHPRLTWDWRQRNYHKWSSTKGIQWEHILLLSGISTYGNIPGRCEQLRRDRISTGCQNLRDQFETETRIRCCPWILR